MADPNIELNTDNLPTTSKYAPKYIPIELIIELKQKNLTSKQIAAIISEKTPITDSAIRHRLAECSDIIEHSGSYKKNRADVLAFHQQQILHSLTQSGKVQIKYAKDVKDMSIAFRNLYDSERLERGQSTANVDYPELSRKLAALHDQRQELLRRKDALVIELQQIGGTYQDITQVDNRATNEQNSVDT